MSADGLRLLRPPVDGPARAVFTTRHGGVSRGPWATLDLGAASGDDPEAVRTNRSRLCAALGVRPERVAALVQVHGADVHEVRAGGWPAAFTGPDLAAWPEGDGLVTSVPDTPLVVLGADCLPVLMWHRDRPRVGAAHAGWRGLVAGVIENAVAVLGDPARTGVAIGPSIGACCYPVSDEVRAVFRSRFGSAVVRGAAVDLLAAARVALARAGVPDDAVWDSGLCTRCAGDDLFSFRAAGGPCGRQAGVVWAVGDAGA